MSSSTFIRRLSLGLGFLLGGTAYASSLYVNVVGASGVSLSAAYPATSDCTGPCGVAVGVELPLSLTATTALTGADQTYVGSTSRDAPVTVTAPSAVGSQVFSHWNGCDSSSGTYLNTCTTSTASAFKQVTAIYTTTDSRIVNISTRAYVGTGENVVILGFMISGGSKRVLIRGFGPSLEINGIYDCLKDPYLTLYQGSTVIATDDDSVVSIRLPHTTTSEAQLYATLAPGAYTAILQASPKSSASTACPQSGMNTGIGLVSVEDKDEPTSPSRLVNISTRAYADLEGSSLQAIAGFVLSGTGKKRVLLKAAGSTLGQYGIAQPLQDPTMGFFSGSNKTYALDNWRDDSNFNIVSTINAKPLHDAESAFLMELSPGAYTVHMGASYIGYTQNGKMTGVGLVSIEEDKGATAGQSSGNYPSSSPRLLPDTGVSSIHCYKRGSDTVSLCMDSDAIAHQDGNTGLDVTSANDSDGKLGFSYNYVGNFALTECVKDNITGLMWEGKTKDGGLRDWNNTYTNYRDNRTGDVGAYIWLVNNQGLCGYTDWRMPNTHELQSIIDYGVAYPGPTIDTRWFPNTKDGFYWTDAVDATYYDNAMRIPFSFGGVGAANRKEAFHVRLVRGTQASSTNRYTYSSDGSEVTDTTTGLVWKRCVEGMTWSGSTCTGTADLMAHEAALTTASHSGWRLPNVKELFSIIDRTRLFPSIDATAFPNSPQSWFRSSTPNIYNNKTSWTVDFQQGDVSEGSPRSALLPVRLVRTTESGMAPSPTAPVTIYKRGVQCETTTYTVSYLGPQTANLVETCPGAVVSMCGTPNQSIYAAGVTALDANLNASAGWSTTRPTCN